MEWEYEKCEAGKEVYQERGEIRPLGYNQGQYSANNSNNSTSNVYRIGIGVVFLILNNSAADAIDIHPYHPCPNIAE